MWLAVEGDALYEDQVLRLEDFAFLVRVPIIEKHAPYLFFTAQSVNQLAVQSASTSVVVLPPDNSLRLHLSFDAESYRPGQAGKARLVVEDAAGRPVRTELALALFDEAVLAIQPEYVGDPRPVFLTAVRQKQAAAHNAPEETMRLFACILEAAFHWCAPHLRCLASI